MKLHYFPTSPYVRKVVVTAAETSLSDRIELIVTKTHDPATELPRDNPLGKIPTLITDDGAKLFDSRVICEYLDSLHDGPKLFPATGDARWAALRLQSLGDGILDAALSCVMEGRRLEAERSAASVVRQKGKIAAAVAALEAEVSSLGDAPTIATITVGCALGYLDFRLPGDDWRSGHAALAAWYEKFAARPSMVASVPQDPV